MPGNSWMEAAEIARSLRRLPCNDEDLSYIPRAHIKNRHCGTHMKPWYKGGREGWIPGALWTAGIAKFSKNL